MKLQHFEESVSDLEHARSYDPRDREITEKLREAQLELKKSKRKDYYALLEVATNSTEDIIKRAYRKKAMEWHPDRFQNENEREHATEVFKEISEAYMTLSDPEKKRRYDLGQDVDFDDFDVHESYHREHTFYDEDFDIFDVFRMYMFFGGGMGFNGGGRRGPHRSGGGRKRHR